MESYVFDYKYNKNIECINLSKLINDKSGNIYIINRCKDE